MRLERLSGPITPTPSRPSRGRTRRTWHVRAGPRSRVLHGLRRPAPGPLGGTAHRGVPLPPGTGRGRRTGRSGQPRGAAAGSAEPGHRIAERAAGRGPARAAVAEVCRLAAGPYGLSRLAAVAAVDNPASRPVLTRNGFSETGRTAVGARPAVTHNRRPTPRRVTGAQGGPPLRQMIRNPGGPLGLRPQAARAAAHLLEAGAAHRRRRLRKARAPRSGQARRAVAPRGSAAGS